MGALKFLKRLFARGEAEEEIDEDAAVQELWKADFSRPERCRFRAEETDDFSASFGEGGFLLCAKHKGAFAWALDPLYRYSDCVIEARISFPGGDGAGCQSASASDAASAGAFCAGFLFRYLNDSTFYEVLVSEKGLVRLDAVINGTPVPILGWTGITEDAGLDALFAGEKEAAPGGTPTYSLRLIAQRATFTVTLNNRWIAECEDDTIQAAGKIAFAVQNWSKADAAIALLSSLSVESRPIEVEALYTRWNQFIKIPAAARRALAETKFAMGQYAVALVELKKGWKARAPECGDLLFAARICLVQRLYTEARDYAQKALDEAKRLEDAQAELEATESLGGVLYACDDFDELDSFLEETDEELVASSPFLLNLAGHSAYNRRDFEKAAERYSAASRKNPEQPIFSLYAGNSLFACGKKKEAVEMWLSAGAGFLRKNSLGDMESLLPRLEKAAPRDKRVIALAVKYHYVTGNAEMLGKYAARAEKAGSDDSSLWYILGLVHAGKGEDDAARECYRRAIALEGDFPPYRFRLAESLFNSNLDYRDELDAALKIGQDDGWTRNLAALAALREGDIERAASEIAAARKLLPEENVILINYAEIERRRGRLDAALKAFDASSGELLRAGGNLLASDGRLEEAESWYAKACKRLPANHELLADRAANCIEIGLLSEADDLLRRSLGIKKTPRAYRLVAFLAEMKGERARAEAVLLAGDEDFPDDDGLSLDLASVYLMAGKPSKAMEIVAELRKRGRADLAESVEREIKEKGSCSISCDACGREWLVPKDIPPQARLVLAARPPDDMPAGKCEQCGKIYCIGCAKPYLDESGRFHCGTCGGLLKLKDSGVIWLLSSWKKEDDARKKAARASPPPSAKDGGRHEAGKDG